MALTNILLETGTNELEVIEFTIQHTNMQGKLVDQSFGVNVAKVREVIRMPKLTAVPNMPKSICGIFTLREKIIPVLDLAEWLFNVKNRDGERKLIVTEFNTIKLGIIVNDVNRIHRFSWTQVESPDIPQDNADASSITGIIKLEDRNILMIDVEKIVADINPKLGIESTTTGSDAAFSGSSYTVLTAEDSATIRHMITSRLNIVGYKLLTFNNGQDAWNELEKISARVSAGEDLHSLLHLIITDIEMPQMDGLTLTKKIRTDKNLSTLPVVIFSSLITEGLLHKGDSVGASAQLTKPQIGLLLDITRELIEKHQKLQTV